LTTTATALLATKSTSWNSHDTRLMVAALAGIALIVLLITLVKLHPFLALIAGSALVSIAAGVSIADVITNFETGVGSTLQEVGLLIALVAMLGKLLAESGGADRVVDTLVKNAPVVLVPWAVALVAMIIGLPMFFEIGLVLLLPVIVLVTKKSGLPLMRVGIPALAGLSVLHGLIPPHPGPLVAIKNLNADLGITLALGLAVAIPTVILCGPVFSLLAAKWVPVGPPQQAGGVDTTSETSASPDAKRPPSFLTTLGTILFPVALMLTKAVADIVWHDRKNPPTAQRVLDFIGEPLTALFLAVILAMITFGYAVGFDSKGVNDRIGSSLAPVAGIILIVGAGGGFKQTLIGAGVGDSVAKAANHSGVSVLVIAYLIAVAIRVATGSATVATTTASGIVVTLAHGLPSTHLALVALAIGAGSLFLSHVNDAGFWLVNQMFRLSVGQTFATWSVMETLVSVVGFGFVSVLWVLTPG
jgi:GntP family gluconate:H+ symporter